MHLIAVDLHKDNGKIEYCIRWTENLQDGGVISKPYYNKFTRDAHLNDLMIRFGLIDKPIEEVPAEQKINWWLNYDGF